MSKEIYTLEELCDSYQLSSAESARILQLCGPARADIDIFMAVSRNRSSLESWALNPTAERGRQLR
ncbi:hypothetical protein [Neorhizobium alkalisoli]|uniref:Uncharacterized protein n=1 Tax=Neorhizobium alkalisoli TaxID=528178 RepID=A0A561QAZ3_9HYPH|nr:hypothetical protein [Neorhizobium alkalisoli]TWF47532.1 hypothetical protein FHW37_11133 [Neorhizobium alkalisoli]